MIQADRDAYSLSKTCQKWKRFGDEILKDHAKLQYRMLEHEVKRRQKKHNGVEYSGPSTRYQSKLSAASLVVHIRIILQTGRQSAEACDSTFETQRIGAKFARLRRACSGLLILVTGDGKLRVSRERVRPDGVVEENQVEEIEPSFWWWIRDIIED